jgi:hypothetical protein
MSRGAPSARDCSARSSPRRDAQPPRPDTSRIWCDRETCLAVHVSMGRSSRLDHSCHEPT